MVMRHTSLSARGTAELEANRKRFIARKRGAEVWISSDKSWVWFFTPVMLLGMGSLYGSARVFNSELQSGYRSSEWLLDHGMSTILAVSGVMLLVFGGCDIMNSCRRLRKSYAVRAAIEADIARLDNELAYRTNDLIA